MSDQQIRCSDCGDVFLFSAAEQEFYAEKGLAAPPKRCKPCRQARKASRGPGSSGGPRRDFSQPRGNGYANGHHERGGPRWRTREPGPRHNRAAYEYRSPAFGGPREEDPAPRRDARRDRNDPRPRGDARPRADDRPRFDIKCSQCGTQATVPFRPIEGRDVFCQPCYRARRTRNDATAEPIDATDDAGIVE
jgi:CxxC-x17-CxxC domain-containing protein